MFEHFFVFKNEPKLAHLAPILEKPFTFNEWIPCPQSINDIDEIDLLGFHIGTGNASAATALAEDLYIQLPWEGRAPTHEDLMALQKKESWVTRGKEKTLRQLNEHGSLSKKDWKRENWGGREDVPEIKWIVDNDIVIVHFTAESSYLKGFINMARAYNLQFCECAILDEAALNEVGFSTIFSIGNKIKPFKQAFETADAMEQDSKLRNLRFLNGI